MFYLCNGAADIIRVVKPNAQLNVFGQVFFDFFDAAIELISNFHMIGARLGNDGVAHHWYSVATKDGPLVQWSQFGIAHIAEADNSGRCFFDDQVVEIIRCLKTAQGSHGKFHRIAFDAS